MLDAGGSSDVGVGSIVGYEWTQLAGAPVELEPDGSRISFRAPNRDTELTFQVTVTDDGGNTATDEVVVTVAAAGLPPGFYPPTPWDLSTPGGNNGSGEILGGCASGGSGGGLGLLLGLALSLLLVRPPSHAEAP